MEKKPISFALLAKEEAAKAERSDEEKRALLSAFIRINGYLRLTKGEEGLELASESASIAKVIYQFLHELYGVEPHFAYTRSAGFLKRVVYHVLVGKEAEDILNDLQVDFFAPAFPKSLLSSSATVSGYLCGAFLAAVIMTHPLFSIPEQIIRKDRLDWLLENNTIRLLDTYGRIFGEAPPTSAVCPVKLQRAVHPP